MATTIHAVVRTDKMAGTKDDAKLRSVKFYNASAAVAEIDNGNIVALAGLLPNQRGVYKGVTPTTDTKLSEIVLIAAPELIYDESVPHNLNEYVNEADEALRGYLLEAGDIFSVTIEGIVGGTPVVGDYATIGASTKITLLAAASYAADDGIIGKFIEVDTSTSETYYVIEV